MPVSSRSPNRCPARSFTENTPVKVKLLLKQKTNISVEIFDFRARRCASLLIWTQLFTEENDLKRCQGAGFIYQCFSRILLYSIACSYSS